MNQINKEEMFGNLKSFLKSKGIELQEGSYAEGIRKSSDMLADAVNLSQRGIENAKTAMGKGLNQLRQTIHEYTAPKSQSAQQAQAKPNGAKAQSSRTARASGKKASTTRAKKRTK
jgi:hypothetical protein